MAETESEKLLAGIGGLLMADDHYPSEPTLLYAQVDRNVTGQPIFRIWIKPLGGNRIFHQGNTFEVAYTKPMRSIRTRMSWTGAIAS